MDPKIRRGFPIWTLYLAIALLAGFFIFWSVILVITSVLTSEKDCHVTSANYWNPIQFNKNEEPDFIYGACCSPSNRNNGNVLCFGGIQPNNSMKNYFWGWKDGTWFIVENTGNKEPIKRAFSMCWLIDDTYYIYGGESLIDGLLLNDFWKYNVKNKKWVIIGYYQEPRSRASFWLDEWKRLNIFGGITMNVINMTTKTSSDILLCDTIAPKIHWQRIYNSRYDCNGVFSKETSSNNHHPPCRHSCSHWYKSGNQFYIYGGIHREGSLLGDTWMWDGKTWLLLSGNFSLNSPSRFRNNIQASKVQQIDINSDHPSNRFGACNWKTKNKLWLFSGKESNAYAKDLWSFTELKGWIFEGGVGISTDDIVGQSNLFLNYPSGRVYSSCWYIHETLYLYFGKEDVNQNWVYNLLD